MSNVYAARSIRSVFAVLGGLLLCAWGANVASADSGQISIAGNGETTIKNAVVTAISGTTITIATGWGETTLSWLVQTSGETAFYPKMESSAILKAIKVGQSISVSGELDMREKHPTIAATVVRVLSLENNAATLSGEITRIDPRSASFLLSVADADPVTIVLASGGVVTRDGDPIGLSQLHPGDEVAVAGSHNFVTHELRALKVSTKSAPGLVEAAALPEPAPERAPVAENAVSPGMLMQLLSWIYAARGSLSVR